MSSALEEQPVTADEAIELINKAKTIVEADMGTKVHRHLSNWSLTLTCTLPLYRTRGR